MGGFNWDLVDDDVIRSVLGGLYSSRGDEENEGRLRAITRSESLTERASDALGSPPRMAFFEKHREVVDALREHWLPLATDATVRGLAARVHYAGDATRPGETKDSQIAYLRNRRNTLALRRAFRAAFVAAHREARKTSRRTAREWSFVEPFELVGRGAPVEPAPYAHQVVAQQQLAELAATSRADGAPFQGLLVLPTGAGKTSTAVGWLLDELRRDTDLRVLWLVHQQELANQAMFSFRDLAERLPEGFVREGRLVHSDANPREVLGSPALSVAAVTYQSLLAKASRKYVSKFMSKPTIVVVDEAHHAGAPKLDGLLEEIGERPNFQGVIGLTATPHPEGEIASRRFAHRFGGSGASSPHIVHEERLLDLIGQGVLARPRFSTVETGQLIQLTPEETSAVNRRRMLDLPGTVQAKVDTERRNGLVAATWVRERERWGKTLVFASQILHADGLRESFIAAGVDESRVLVLHSGAGERAYVLREFGQIPPSESAVLISVGMLLEGIDIPDVQTAFLARPTTSQIVMQQMVGRALRGPKAGGTSEALIVHFHDEWNMMAQIVSPRAALSMPPGDSDDDFVGESELLNEPLPEVPLEEATVEEMAAASLDEVQEEREHLADEAGLFTGDLTVRDLTLVGYYRLDDGILPVFDACQDVLAELVQEAAAGREWTEESISTALAESGPPVAPLPSVMRLLDLAGELNEVPTFHPMSRHVSAREIAQEIRAAGALTDDERAKRIETAFASPFARTAFPSLARFETEVHQELRRLRTGAPVVDIEQRIPTSTGADLRLLPRHDRDLAPIFDLALAHGRATLRGDQRARLATAPTPEWTSRVIASTFGHLTTDMPTGSSTLRARLFVNRLFRTSEEHVSDRVLGFIVWHEVLHHVLPLQGHDDEFRELEETWPDMVECAADLSTLHEQWNANPKAYADSL